ncbi:hypothetical protein RO3G_06841 [Rhizopus delemar RA 99-880]|uniref:Uncharacterized protein n=1 Tax=Rhizopus delemar (strain RA 99-880 / ATCC MYA-4621 / FGSC 9543 / NRRL 43880) TaxID=246409 RepID=I1C106_RHIO9|nr:hypothetical protein RO3G_06841 [Rhizopus delemar RA 99-880]|eukprot:EIE82136.1 hypothetical protein RO3G_06841 [Rhizopus delemar RA 99-880]
MNPTLDDTVLAWSQNELTIYSTLSLISPLSDLNSIDDEVIVCLAHRYFPESVPNLIQQLRQPNHDSLSQLFQERVGIVPSTNTFTWLHQLQQWVTLQENIHKKQEGFMEFETNANQLLSRLLQLYHQWVDLLTKEEQSVTSSKTERKGKARTKKEKRKRYKMG